MAIKNLDETPTREPTFDPTPELAIELTKHKKFKLKVKQEFMKDIIANKKNKNDGIFWNYVKYENPSFLAKDLIRAAQAKNEELANNVNDSLIDLRNATVRKENPENINPNKIVDIVEKSLDFNKQQKGKGIKILTPKQM